MATRRMRKRFRGRRFMRRFRRVRRFSRRVRGSYRRGSRRRKAAMLSTPAIIGILAAVWYFFMKKDK